jgi:Tol biopolymer transport system component
VLIASATAGVVLAAAVAGVYYLTRPSGGTGGAPEAAAFPKGQMLVRIDTAPGWPKTCHGDIGLFTPGDGSVRTLVQSPACELLPERSPDGKQVAFTRMDARGGEAWVMNADGSGARRVATIARGTRVTWSPDGTRLAYMAERDGVRQIFAVALRGGAVSQLTRDDSAKDDPMWSSTNRIVFWSRRDGGAEQVYSLDAGRPGGHWTRLTADGVRAVDPEWSPDGSKIAYVRGPVLQSDIWVMNADGSGAHALTSGTVRDMDPVWSRDGSWLCYVRGVVTDPVIHAVRADGTGDRVLTPAGRVLGHPNW